MTTQSKARWLAFGFATAVIVPALCVTGIRETHAADSQDWPTLRGPDGTAYVTRGNLPAGWEADQYLWTVELPGSGIGSPAIHDGEAYVLVADTKAPARYVVALDMRTGDELWRRRFALTSHHLHPRNTFASSTPYVDGTGIYVAWADPERVTLAALEHDGEVRWERDLGPWQSQHGFGTSPVLLDGKVVLMNSQQGEQLDPSQQPGVSRLMAFDPATGETVWETALTTTRACYGVPILRTAGDGRKEIIGANTGDGIFAVDAENGVLRWRLPVFRARCVSSPLLVGDLLLGSAGSGGGGNHMVAVRPPEGKAGSTQPSEAYRVTSKAPYVPTPAVVGSRLFMVDDRGFASCVDAETGESIWMKRIGGNYGASPIVIGDRLLVISLDGKATVLRAADDYELLASFELGGPVQATPAWAGDLLLLRIGDRLCALPTAK